MVDRTTMSRLVLGMWISLLCFLLQNNTPVLYGCCKEGNSIHTLTSAKAMKRKEKKSSHLATLVIWNVFTNSRDQKSACYSTCERKNNRLYRSIGQPIPALYTWVTIKAEGKKRGSDLYKHAWHLICTAGNRRRKQMLRNKYAQHNWSHCLVATRAQNLRFTQSSNTDFPNVLDTHQKYACPYTPVLFLPHKHSFTWFNFSQLKYRALETTHPTF